MCGKCNLGLGHFDDSGELLGAALRYLGTLPAQRNIA
jgi:hypothetical protein